MTPRQFWARLKAVQEVRRSHYELVRMQTYLICSPNLKRGTSMRRFWPLPWDKETNPKFEAQTAEDRAAWRDRAKKIIEHQRQIRRGNNSAT